jgi:putative hemolysin
VLAFIFGAVGVTSLLIFFGEVIPKSISVQWARFMAYFCTLPLLTFYYLIWPIQFVVTSTASLALITFRIKPQSEEEFVSDEEMRIMVTHGVQESSVEEQEIEMIGGVLGFSDATADEIMTPRTEVQAYPIETPRDELIDSLRQSKHSRVLIYKESLDEVTGALHVKELLLNPDAPLENLVREPLLIPPKKDLYELLKEFRIARSHIAVVLDEFGGSAGIVTLNDLLEEIFGKIEEEEEDRETLIIPEGNDTYRIRGKIDIEELNEKFEINLSEEQGRTLSGYLFNLLGHIPKPSEKLSDDWGEYEILEVEKRRIIWVRATWFERSEEEKQETENTKSL